MLEFMSDVQTWIEVLAFQPLGPLQAPCLDALFI
jgi:hypothetical protein